MKFGAQLQSYTVPEWEGKYVKYTELKRWLNQNCPTKRQTLSTRIRSFGSQQGFRSSYQVNAEFMGMIESTLEVIEEHFNFESAFFFDRLDGIDYEVQEIERLEEDADASRKHHAHKDRLMKAAVGLWDCFDRLNDYKTLNLVAFQKIMKARDKHLSLNCAADDIKPIKTRMNALQIPEEKKKLILAIFSRCSDEEAPDMARLEAAVQKQFLSQAHQPGIGGALAFWLGIIAVVLVDIGVLLAIPTTNPTFDMRVVAPTFPVYRLSICLCLMTWGAGTCLRVYEHYGVNYKFMLDVDPKCTVDSGCLLFIASVQTGVVLVSLLCFLADYKFCLLGSTHFIHAYCIGNLAIQILILCWPSQVVRREYRRSTLRMVLEVFKSAFVTPTAVSFPDALVGDVLTSIVKPLADLFTTVCYATELAVWGTAGTLGTRWFDVVSPILAAMPLIVRIQQNYSRYSCTRDRTILGMVQHWQVLRFSFGNFFKQRAVALHQHVGLLVPTHLGSYVFATLYTLFWDFTMDWQLMPDPNSFLRASDKVMFPQWLYSLIGVMNVSGRLTWAMTLMPIHILSSELLMSTVLALIVSAVEIVRRCGWCILKLETEHLTNSSRYRAMLWVPKLNTREAKQVRDVVADRAAEEETWEKLARTAEAESAVPSKDASKNTVATILALARLKSRRPESKGTSKWDDVRTAFAPSQVD